MSQSLIEKILNPSKEFTPIPFWFWNDALTDEEIIRQMKDFHEKGVDGVVLHPRIGMPESIPYLSDVFMHFVRTAVETAAELGMYIVLYDEAMYPSGSAHGLVVAENPAYASQGIILTDDPTAGKLIHTCGDGRHIVQINSGGRIRGIHFGEDDGQPGAPPAGDLLSQDAVDAFIRITHERYYEVVGEYFGSTVIGFFTDEPMMLGRGSRPGCLPWTWGFEEDFAAMGGDLEELEALFVGGQNASTRLYEEAIARRELEVYYQSLHRFCEEHGIALMGHPHRGDDIDCESCFHIPGQDVVWRVIGPERGGLTGEESAQGKCSSDAARVKGRRRNSNECFGVCVRDGIPWYFTGGDMKWYLDYLGVRGVNLFIPHAFYYSTRDARKDERPPDVGPNNIWWEHYATIAGYMKRLSSLMTDSDNEARVCVLCENRGMRVEEVKEFFQNQVEFNYLPYAELRADMVRDGKLYVGDHTYDYVYCDDRHLVNGVPSIGGVGDLPYRDLYTQTSAPDLRVTRIKKDGVRMAFLTNEGNEVIDTEAALDGETSLVAVDLWRGTHWRVPTRIEEGRTRFPLLLGARESLLLVLDDTREIDAPPPPEKHYAEVDFTLLTEDEERFVKTYVGTLTVKEGDYRPRWIRVEAEEMVECFVNGRFAGFSLWNPHEPELTDLLEAGDNEIILRVTGNAANRFTPHRIAYGLL